jgi:Transmembrane domain of unknown function (DUF3566)
MADTEQSSGILGTSPVRTATWPAAATAAKETPAKEDSAIQASANGTSAAGENGTGRGPALADVPGLPAGGIGATRDSFAFNRPVAAPVSPADDGRTLAETGASPPGTARVPAENEPVATESAAAETGTGWPAKSAEVQASGGPEPSAVSAAAFVSDPPQPTPSSSVRNFLRSGASAKTSSPPRTPAVSVNPPKAQTVPGGAPVAGGAPVPGARAKSKGSAKRSARQAHLTIARVEPWSVMKFSFVVSLIAFVILFVAVSVIYGTLSALGVFTSLQHVVQSVTSSQDSSGVNAAKWFTESRVLSYTALLGALNIVLITAMATIGAVVYNLTSRLIGGVEVTLRETE